MKKIRTSSFFLLPSSFQKGSALLIVLGMLSFMIVSAVGFSIYMRSSRTPSSYLRRNVAARYLARAALAKAIEELEGDFNSDPDWGKVSESETDVPTKFYGVYDDPFPGVVLNDSTARASASGRQNGDYWVGRVFMPFGAVRSTDATVATMPLEGLAYLPPAIVDDVRRLSRLTRTASWRPFPYDAGRYAYCAVNVSDLFDINRLQANVPRNSGPGRVTLASLCATNPDDMMDLNAGNAIALDDLLGRVEDFGKLYGNVVPFTSLADFNFAAGTGSDYAPFMKFVGGNGVSFLSSTKPQQANALFITDTWFPPKETAAGETVYDLAANAQPFSDYNASSFIDVLLRLNPALGSSADNIYVRNLGLGIVALYDYLDSDSVPTSLSLPTVEAVPMVVGVSAPIGLSPQFGEIGARNEDVGGIAGKVYYIEDGARKERASGNITAKRKLTQMGVTSFGGPVNVPIVVTSPFKRLAATSRAKSYKVRGLMRVWLAPDGMGCRPGVPDNLYPSEATWRDCEANNHQVVGNGVATFLSDDEVSLSSFASDVKSTGEAIAEAVLKFSNLDVKMPVFYKVEESDPQPSADDRNAGYVNVDRPSIENTTFKETYYSFGDIKDKIVRPALCPLQADGAIDSRWRDGSGLVKSARFDVNAAYPNGVTELTQEQKQSLGPYRLYAAIWLQVRDGTKVVDMAPACATDDVWLGSNLPDNNAVANKLGDGAPLLNFKGDADITFENIETTMSQAPAFNAWKALYAVDPRYNFAPEDWFSSSASAVASKSEWMQLLGLNGTSSQLLGQNGRDRDIFMFVSDQEYLQSVGELQFLPRLDVMDGSGSFLTGDYSPDFHGRPFSQRTGPTTGSFANGGRFWKTYTAFNNGDGTVDINPYKLKDKNGKVVEVKSGTGGFKLNPFSRDDRVIGAALIGTPFDYYVASTNSNQRQSGGRRNNLAGNMSLSQMMSTYSFGRSSLAKLSSDELSDIAGEIKDRFEANADAGKTDWVDAWDSLMWQENSTSRINDENKTFMDADITLSEPLHGVDRKYLYSFWRECFDNRQQLFLLFVRAEPSSVGGGGLSRASSQLGSRAVALVWRDPEPPTKNPDRPLRTAMNSLADCLDKRGSNQNPPHRTRVLFYHQFD